MNGFDKQNDSLSLSFLKVMIINRFPALCFPSPDERKNKDDARTYQASELW